MSRVNVASQAFQDRQANQAQLVYKVSKVVVEAEAHLDLLGLVGLLAPLAHRDREVNKVQEANVDLPAHLVMLVRLDPVAQEDSLESVDLQDLPDPLARLDELDPEEPVVLWAPREKLDQLDNQVVQDARAAKENKVPVAQQEKQDLEDLMVHQDSLERQAPLENRASAVEEVNEARLDVQVSCHF